MSFFSRLFGFNTQKGLPVLENFPSELYEGFTITPTPYREGGEYQLAGKISKEFNGVLREYIFVRADRLPSANEAARLTLLKGRQIIHENGDQIFDQRSH